MTRVTKCTLLARPIRPIPYKPQLTFAGVSATNEVVDVRRRGRGPTRSATAQNSATPSSGVEACAYRRRGIRPAR
jgi:hypothetical protein